MVITNESEKIFFYICISPYKDTYFKAIAEIFIKREGGGGGREETEREWKK